MRKKALIAVFIILALGAAAQNNSELTIADTPVAATSNLDEIRIEGFVPNFLKISLDFAPAIRPRWLVTTPRRQRQAMPHLRLTTRNPRATRTS